MTVIGITPKGHASESAAPALIQLVVPTKQLLVGLTEHATLIRILSMSQASQCKEIAVQRYLFHRSHTGGTTINSKSRAVTGADAGQGVTLGAGGDF